MLNINAPPIFKSSVGIDSVYVQIKGINKYDLYRFCREYDMKYDENGNNKYTRKWKIFLAGGQPITVSYHFRSKSMTFQIGKLLNYSKILCEQHIFAQNLVQFFSSYEINISRLDYAVDVKEPLSVLSIESTADDISEKIVATTRYFNMRGSTFCIYDKALQLKIYSTSLTRIELRLSEKMGYWKVKNFMEDRKQLLKLSNKVTEQFTTIRISSVSGNALHIDIGNPVRVIEEFIAFLQGNSLPKTKDPFKVWQAIQSKDKFLLWARGHGLKSSQEIKRFVKGSQAKHLQEIGIDHKTFNKAVNFYRGIPNFQVPA